MKLNTFFITSSYPVPIKKDRLFSHLYPSVYLFNFMINVPFIYLILRLTIDIYYNDLIIIEHYISCI